MTRHDPDRGMAILSAIEDFTRAEGYAPNVRELTARVGLASTSATHHWIERLVSEGRLKREPGMARSLRVIPQPEPGICLRPGCGKKVEPPRTAFCSRSCDTIAAHVRRWLRAAGYEHLLDVLGATPNVCSSRMSVGGASAEPNRLSDATVPVQLAPGGGRRFASGSKTDAA